MKEVATSRSRWRHWIWSMGLALALAAVSILALQVYRTAHRADALRDFLSRTGLVLRSVQQLETIATRMESDQRGFLITGDRDLERARDRDYQQVVDVIATLRPLLHGDADQSQRLLEAEQSLRRRYDHMLATSTTADMDGLVAARATFDLDSTGEFEAIHQQLLALREAEQRRLVQFTAAAGTSARRFNDALSLGALLALALLAGITLALWVEMRRGDALRAALAHSDAMQRAVLDSAGLMVIACDPSGVITVFNQAARYALGYEAAELVGKSDPRVFHLESEVRARAHELTQELGIPIEPGFEVFVAKARRGTTDVGRWTYVRRDGSTFRVQLAVSAVRDPEGTLLGFVGIAQDVTEHELAHERLRQSEQRLRMVIQTASDAFIAIDSTGVIEEWNAQAERMLGWNRAEALGRRLSELVIPERHRDAHEAGLRHFLDTGHGPVLNRRIEISALDRNDLEFPIELTIWPMYAGSRTFFNAFLQDITERNASQDAIRQLNAELKVQAEQLEQSNSELEGFSYSVSHDLRAPLRHMSGYAQILREEAGEQLDASLLRYIDEISASARRMGALIDDLLAFSRLSRQLLTPIAMDMNSVVADAMSEAGLAAQNPRARIEVAHLPRASGDPVLLRQVWINLLSNAVKYSAPRGADALIQVDGEIDGDHVRYRIRDNGVGFDPRYADKLFGVFQRLHAQDEFEGTGVGLAIVQRVVARHRGRVSAHAQPGQGAEFTFELPTTPAEEAQA